jgi:hypothetical protein
MRLTLSILSLVIAATFISSSSFAQTSGAVNTVCDAAKQDTISSTSNDTNVNATDTSHIVYVHVPKQLNIKDKIYLVNRSQTTILQAAVVLVSVSGANYTSLGSATLVMPNCRYEMASFSGNKLKRLKDQTIGVKIKGVKKVLGDINRTGIAGGSYATGAFGLGISHKEIKADELNNLDPSLITYDYSVSLSEENHDLYITVTNGANALDF